MGPAQHSQTGTQLLREPAGDAPNRPLPLLPACSSLPFSPRRMLALLFLLTLTTRIVMAVSLQEICNDAYYYFEVAQYLVDGDLRRAFAYLNLNVYPAVLALLTQAGAEPAAAGRVWGVLTSALTVLPLFGLYRRLFDLRIALAGCFLYAVHPGLIEISAEPIREPTFWLLFATGLYLARLCMEDPRPWRFLLCGLVLTLTVHTRTEGWLIVPVLAGWAAMRAWRGQGLVRRMAVGTTLCLAVTPLMLLAVNVTLLRHHAEWEWGRLNHFRIGYNWATCLVCDTPDDSPVASTRRRRRNVSASARRQHVSAEQPQRRDGRVAADEDSTRQSAAGAAVAAFDDKAPVAASPPCEYSTAALAARLVNDLAEATELSYLLLLGVGYLYGRQYLTDRYTWLLLPLGCVVVLTIWIQAWHTIHEFHSVMVNDRYFFTALLLVLPFAGIGLLGIAGGLRHVAGRFQPTQDRAWLSIPIVCGMLTGAGCFDAWYSRHGQREHEVAVGRRLNEQYGPFRSVIINNGARRVGYYLSGRVPRRKSKYSSLLRTVGREQPELIVLYLPSADRRAGTRVLEDVRRTVSPAIAVRQLPTESPRFVAVQLLQQPKTAETARTDRNSARQ